MEPIANEVNTRANERGLKGSYLPNLLTNF